jgi:hypothetical protein
MPDFNSKPLFSNFLSFFSSPSPFMGDGEEICCSVCSGSNSAAGTSTFSTYSETISSIAPSFAFSSTLPAIMIES